MQPTKAQIIIIGAGLTGLTLAYRLRDQFDSVLLLEARDRLGGRILTSCSNGKAPIELGATWLGQKHRALNALLTELGVGIFPQILGETAIYEAISTSPHQLVQLPPNPDPSFRIQGGTSALIAALTAMISTEWLQLNQTVTAIDAGDATVSVQTTRQLFEAEVVVSTLPPFLLQKNVSITPSLPPKLRQTAQQTHTWMGESIKVGLRYAEPFWREPGTSGTIFSNVGPITEFYDHSNVEDDQYALKGFMNPSYAPSTRENRLALLLGQIRKYYGAAADGYLEYEEAVWRNERFTFTPYQTQLLPHQNNGHTLYQRAYFDGRLYVAGSETGSTSPGYMEGAVQSADFIFSQITKQFV